MIALIYYDDFERLFLQEKTAHLSAQKTEIKHGGFDHKNAQNYTHIICVAHPQSKEFLAHLGAHINIQPLTDCDAIIDDHTLTRAAYAGNAVMTMKDTQDTKLISLTMEQNKEKSSSDDLRHARVVVGGGRSFGSADNFKMAYDLANILDGVVGATRAAVDAGYIGNEKQIGQTGQTISAALYLACGISGAIQHVSGIRSVDNVIAINTDPNAPIFRHATYGLVADIFDVLPELTNKLKS